MPLLPKLESKVPLGSMRKTVPGPSLKLLQVNINILSFSSTYIPPLTAPFPANEKRPFVAKVLSISPLGKKATMVAALPELVFFPMLIMNLPSDKYAKSYPLGPMVELVTSRALI